MMAYRIAKQATQFAGRQGEGGTMPISLFNFGEWFRMASFTSAHAKHMTSRQHPNAGPPGKGLGNVAPQIKPDQAGGLATGIDRHAPRQPTGLGTKPERACTFCHIEWLDAVRIADKPQLLFHTIPQREGVHATELTKAGFAPVGDDVDQHFGIAVGSKIAAQSLKFFTQRTIVVNLAIEADDPAAGHIAHRLRALGPGINNGKTPVAEHNTSICCRPKTSAIRTTPALLIVETLHDALLDRPGRQIEGEAARNATHVAENPNYFGLQLTSTTAVVRSAASSK